MTLLALGGFAAAWAVPPVAPARDAGGLFDTLRGALSALQADRLLRLAITGAVFFWTIASLVVQNVLVYAKAVLGLSDALATVPSALISVGIGLGALVVGRLSPSRVEYGLVPLGAAGVATFLLILGWWTPPFGGTLALMIALGMSSALIFIPTAKDITILRRAEHIFFIADGGLLIKDQHRHAVKKDVFNMIGRCIESNLIKPDKKINLIVTKWDLIVSNGKVEDIKSFFIDPITEKYSGNLAKIIKVASRSINDDVPSRSGIDEFLDECLIRPSINKKAFVPDLVREYQKIKFQQ